MENTAAEKKTVFSAIQPSGSITLGNFLGAWRGCAAMQDEYRCIYALADLHTITVRQEPAKFRKNTLEAYAVEKNLAPFADLIAGLVDRQLDRYLRMEETAQEMDEKQNRREIHETDKNMGSRP